MLNKLTLLGGISLLAIASPAFAQEVAPDQAANANEDASDQAIVVTGSRIVKNGDLLPTPVTMVSSDTLLKTSPSNIPDGLKKLPIFANSRGTAVQGDATDNATGAYLNLRGFGIQRNLILLDGHRVAPTSYTGAVDTNVLPQMLMSRVDVVTGGASAVYGSDAVSGVVNFVLDKKFTGLKVEANSGISSRGDAFSWRAAGAFGANFADGRGHFMASFEHFDQKGILKEDRESGLAGYGVVGSGTTADPFRAATGVTNNFISFRGLVNPFGGPLAGQVFTGPGVTGPFVHGVSLGGGFESGGEGFYGKTSSGTADVRTDQAFARLDYDFGGVNFYAQGSFAKSYNFNYFYPNLLLPFPPVAVSSTNAFLAASTQATLSDPLLGGGSTFLFERIFDDLDHRIAVRADTENWSAAAGLDGKISNLSWNVHYQHGVSTTKNYFINNTINGRMSASLDAVDAGQFAGGAANGNIVCRVTLTNPTAYPGCVPFNAFGVPLGTQQKALDYVFGTSITRPRNTMDSVEASLSGDAFNNWAGPVRFAVSAEYRRLALDVTTNAPATLMADCTGVRFNCTQGVTPYFSNAQITPISVSETVKEGAIEVEFPLLENSAIGRASLNGAFRYTDYSTSGSVTTWKIGGDWEPVDGLRLRGTYSRDIRAPSLYDLFQPATTASSGYTDVHTGFQGILPTQTAGNANLTPEIAKTLTFGAVYHPPSIRGLSIAVDYYRITMANAITEFDGRNPTIQNLCEAANGTGPFCTLFVRPNAFSDRTQANAPSLVKSTKLNAASLKTWGIDTEVNYQFNVGSEGLISLRGLVGYQPQLDSVLVPGTPATHLAGAASVQQGAGIAKWRVTGFVSYSNPNFSVDVQERWRSSLNQSADPALVYAIPKVPSVAYTDLTLTAFIGKSKARQIYFSVQNLFDKAPPPYTAVSGTPLFQYPLVTGDDLLGRYFTVGARFKF
jgi:outer membrane receptor protein involved in Fe transport